jgi:hypothetical protein
VKKILILFLLAVLIYWLAPPKVERFTAEKLFELYAQNEEAANQKLLGKWVRVEGTIAEIGQDEKNRTTLLLETQDSFSGILCVMRLNQELNHLNIGDVVKVKGRCNGFLLDVVLEEASLD